MRISDWSSDVCSSDLAALMLGRQQRAPATVPVFALLRTDHERAAGGADALPMGVAADDWLEEDPAQKRRLRLSLKLGRLFNRDPMAQRAARQRRLAEWRLQSGPAELSAGETGFPDALTPPIPSAQRGRGWAVGEGVMERDSWGSHRLLKKK